STHVLSARLHADGVAVIELHDREARNMFSAALVDGLKRAFAAIGADASARAVVLCGYDSYFATGGTRDTLLAIQEGQARFTDETVFQAALECALPVVAAVQGHAIGGGWAFAMFADLAVLSAESRYLSPYMGYGFTPGAGSTLVFPARIATTWRAKPCSAPAKSPAANCASAVWRCRWRRGATPSRRHWRWRNDWLRNRASA
ncbi:enoyl-CoA hydratase/isomerase family protein, partial [Streptomyces sp. S9]|nr:enoyl-CoA hydratase/isomerase family protein [Streptomyces sp. S9]